MKAWLKHAARALAGAAVALSLAAAAWAQSADVVAPIQAHPAIWTVHGPSGTAYLLGSIHVLPPQMRWRTPEIDAALDASDVFVFEVPMDDSSKEKVQDFVKDNGLLPPGMALPSMLNEQERKDYTAAIALTHVPPELLTPMRPWLALLTLNAGFIEQQHLSPASGLDRQVYAFAQKKEGASFRAFETAEQQLRLLMPQDKKLEMQEFVKDNGLLPPGMALPSMLNEQERKDYTAAIALTHVPPELLTPMRPWLALLTLNAGFIEQQHLSPASGLDRQVYAFTQKKEGASFRAFETAEQQLRLLMPQDKKLEMQEFDAGLKDLLTETKSVHELLNAWARGDVDRLSAVMNAGFKGNREAEKALFEDRNRAWVTSIEKMLGEKHPYFITVGAGHLAGPKGVPASLRREGYKVDVP